MKKTFTAAVLAALLLSTGLPSFAQKGGTVRKPGQSRKVVPTTPSKGDFAQFDKVEAFTDGLGTMIQWHMAAETGNAGFQVYRLGTKGSELVNPSPIPGSAALIGRQPVYGQGYEFYDPEGGLSSTYVIQAMGMDGRRISSETINSKYTYDIEGATGRLRRELRNKVDNQNGNIEKTQPAAIVQPRVSSKNLMSDSTLSTDAADLNTHRWVVGQPGAKIAVRAEGLYRVRISELQAVTGIFNSGNTPNWRLFKEGLEQSIIVSSDATGLYLEFYGKGIDTAESDTSIYYLIVDPTTQGRRITTARNPLVSTTNESVNYSASMQKKLRSDYWGSIMNGDAENWWGPLVTNSSASLTMNLTGIDFSVPTTAITLKLQGVFFQTDHLVKLIINGNEVGTVFGPNDQSPFSGTFTSVPTNYLREGNNNVQLTAMNGSGDYDLFDSMTVNYARKYQAIQNKLTFPTPNNQKAAITGFTSNKIRVFDLRVDGDPAQVVRLPITLDSATSTYTLNWPAMARRQSTIFCVEGSAILQSPAVTANVPSSLASSTPNADLIIIHHSDPQFKTAADAWADYRRSATGGSFNVVVVSVDDIFDEYSYGSSSSLAINSFLRDVKLRWPAQIAGKQYVLLMGDASKDPRNYKDLGYNDLIPTRMVGATYGEAASDDTLADVVSNNTLADMAIGRIPARDASFITTVFNKTQQFETPAMQSPDRGVVFAYDIPKDYPFASMSDDLASQMPASIPKVYVGRGLPAPNEMTLDPDRQTKLVNAINNPVGGVNKGRYLVNYSGHGAQTTWEENSFLGNSGPDPSKWSVPLLQNIDHPAIFTMLTCLNGYFVGYGATNDDSLADLLIKSPAGGGVASFASTGSTTADIQMTMARQFYRQIGLGNIKLLGDLVRDSKSVIPADSDVNITWELFGDPSLRVRQ